MMGIRAQKCALLKDGKHMNMDIWPRKACGGASCEKLAQLFGDLAHPLRLALVRYLLATQEDCVCSLSSACHVDQPTLSRHLRILKDHGVLLDRREGTRVFYHVVDPRVAPILDSLGVLDLSHRSPHFTEEEP
jgi:DNA-binding transcriptional ArsR family regulator